MKKNKNTAKAFSLIVQIGISMLTPILLCIAAGYFADQWLNTSFITPILVLLGILASFRNVYYLTKGFYAEDLKREKEELKYFEDLKNFSKKNPKKEENSEEKEKK